jgi:hypothetical protein
MSWATGLGSGFATGVGFACTKEKRSVDATRAVLSGVENMLGGGRVRWKRGAAVIAIVSIEHTSSRRCSSGLLWLSASSTEVDGQCCCSVSG